MHLTQLTIKGFKSFASATTLKLEPGITCVVGPNGSGKSNVVDALSWVMGEQGAKSLRGGKMEDVIFAGTSKRPALGRAEVSLTIDNTDGLLPIDYSEVTISRTLFRAGGSEYAINGEACRLLDIQELLSDTGMGREMHVIVGQGRLDSVLQATPEERRGFIEEAAGVLKHRRRKEKALRKLDAMAANLARVSDLTGEIRRQLGPLARQAAVARRAQVIQAEVRDARLRILADDLVQAISVLEQDHADHAASMRRTEELEKRQAELGQALAEAETAAAELAPQLSAATDAFYALSSARERFCSLDALAQERARNLATPITAPAGRDPEELERRAQEAQEAEQQAAEEVTRAKETLAQRSAAREQAEQTEREADTLIAALHRGVADRREGIARLTGQVGAKRTRLEAVQEEAARRRSEIEEAKAAAQEAAAKFARLEQEAIGDEEGEEALDRAHETAVSAAELARAELARLTQEETEARSLAVAAEARRDALAMSLERQDATGALLAAAGVHGADSDGDGARGNEADAAKLGQVRGVRGALPDFLHVEPGWEDAAAAALGQLVDAALVAGADAGATRDVAVDTMRQVREADIGHVRLVLASVGSASDGADGADGADEAALAELRATLPDGAAVLLDLVTFDEDVPATLPATIRSLLRGVVSVEGLVEARSVLAGTDEAAVTACVTREGDVLARTWAAGGGPHTPSVLQLHAAREAADAEHHEAMARLERVRFARGPAEEKMRTAEQEVAATLADLHASDARITALAEQLGQLGAAQKSAEERVARAEPAIARAEAESIDLDRELKELLVRLETAQAAPDTAQADVEAAQVRRAEAAEAARNSRSAETEARLMLRTAEERLKSQQGRAGALRHQAAQEREARRRAAEREAQRARKAELVRGVSEAVGTISAAIEASVQRAGEERDQAQAERTQREQHIARLRADRDQVSGELTKLKDAAHREELARAEQRLRVEHLQEKALDDLGIDPEVLIDEYGPHLPIPDVAKLVELQQLDEPGQEDGADGAAVPTRPFVRDEQEKRLTKAERDLTRLGKINPLALEEHAALEERHAFLTQQLADLEKSRDDLLGIVSDIDERVERVFTEAFEDTAREFVDVFATLFPGGEGKLVLTDPDDMLATGIEVEARPAGKKVKRLSLLSGGERSLTAVALLVAIFKARPSPFYVMDEVEAALDDVNLGRLLEIFRELQENSQLIVITHQKRTMEIADALYGITMRHGVTEVISQRIDQSEQERVSADA